MNLLRSSSNRLLSQSITVGIKIKYTIRDYKTIVVYTDGNQLIFAQIRRCVRVDF